MERFFKHPWLIVLVLGLLTLFFALQLPRVQLDNNNLRFVPKDDPALNVSQSIDKTFGSSLFVLIGLERKYGSVFEGDFLNLMREFISRIEEISIVKESNSLVTADYITAEEGAIAVKKLVGDDFSGTGPEIAELKRRVLSWDLYRRTLVSDDFTATQILIPLDIDFEDAGKPEVIRSFLYIRDLARDLFAGHAEVYVTGLPVISATINEAVHADLVLLVPLVIAVVLGVLFFSFRRLAAVALPLLTVLIAAVWSIGAMPLFGVKLSIISTVLPVILIAVGSAYGIHVITHYTAELGGRSLSDAEHRLLIFTVLRKIGKPVFLAALTTFAGFGSFCFTMVLPIREFGFFSSFGVLASFGVAVTLIPSLLIIRGPKSPQRPGRGGAAEAQVEGGLEAPGSPVFDPLSGAVADALISINRKRRLIMVLTAGVILFSLYGLSQVIIDNIMVEYFKSDTDIARSDRFIREHFGGSKVVNVVAEADSSEILLRPEALGALDDLCSYLEAKVPQAGKVLGFTALVKRINQVFNADESPDGLKPSGADTGGAGFGFGNDGNTDGTPGFGFGNAGNADGTPGFGFGNDGGADGTPGFGFGNDGGADGTPGFGFGNAGGADGTPGFGFGNAGGADGTPGFGFGGAAAAQPNQQGRAGGIQPADRDRAAPAPQDPDKSYTQQELLALFDQAGGKSWDMDVRELIGELKRQVNYEGAAYYEIPRNPAKYGKQSPGELQRLVSNYLALLSGNISAYANDPLEPTAVRSTIQLRTLGEYDSAQALREIDGYIQSNFPPNVRTTVGGTSLVEFALNTLVVKSQLISVIISLIMVFAIIALSNRSLAAGCIGIAPLSISILINFAVMGLAGIKLNIGTSMVASVSVGIGIDYTIHYLDTYKREYQASGGTGDFLRRTFATSGKAIIINAVSVGAGFAVLLLSRFNMLGNLGLLIALTMATSALVSLTVIPTLLTLLRPRFVLRQP
ncbi:MAG: MMPL family transporter [Treponema sp.]|jgi:predicted RND superfamily exporter protein|nr:MMPL family transporter [Treponema sp.]